MFDDLAGQDHIGRFEPERDDLGCIGAVDHVGIEASVDCRGDAWFVCVESDEFGGDLGEMPMEPTTGPTLLLPKPCVGKSDVDDPLAAALLDQPRDAIDDLGSGKGMSHFVLAIFWNLGPSCRTLRVEQWKIGGTSRPCR